MKPLVLLFSLLLSGCVTAPIESFYDGTYFVAEIHSEDLKNAKTPQGFLISPAEAFSLLRLDPAQKYSWSIYADSKNYFLVENIPLVTTTSALARMYGRRVNGRTGKTDAIMEY